MRPLRWLSTSLGRWPLALAACALLSAVVLLPGLGAPGFWDPQERQLADKLAPPLDVEAKTAALAAKTPPAPVAPPADGCWRTAPPDAAARTLTARAIKLGRDSFGDSDTGRRLPLALLGFFTALATAGIAMRLGGARAGLVAAIVALSMPLLTLQSRMLMSEIGTPCGGALIVYGFVALARLAPGRAPWLKLVDGLVATASIAAGALVGFYGGGALLGLVVPIGAVAAAGSFGVAAVAAVRRRESVAPYLPALVATVAAGALIGVLAHELYALKPVVPGLTPPPAREVANQAILPTGCWSSALGALWKPDDDLRYVFDSSWEQIAFGTFPWGLLAPVAMAAMLASPDARRRSIGALTLAWAGGAWIATEAFQRKVGFTIYAGFPAMAVAIGVWVDDLLARGEARASKLPAGALLVALFLALGVLDIGKDIQSFDSRFTSIFVGGETIAYPKQSTLLFIPTKIWILALGVVIAVAFALGIAMRASHAASPVGRRIARLGPPLALAGTILMAAFWSLVWQPRLGQNLSSKALFDTYKDLRHPGDQLVVMGDLGQAARAYAGTDPEVVPDRAKIVAALGRPNRVFAIAPQTELCTLHREIGGKPYFVVDDRNLRSLLLSNKLDGATDKNPLATAIVHAPPKDTGTKPAGDIIFDNRVQLLGWKIPKHVARGSKFEVTLYYKILQPVGGAWTTIMHFDSPAPLRFNGDHKPINDRCPTSTWQPGDYIIDQFTVSAASGPFAKGTYELRTGFFTGSSPNFKNMPVSKAPPDTLDAATDRVKLTTIVLD